LEEFKEPSVEVIFRCLKKNLDISTPTGQAMFQMMAVDCSVKRDLALSESIKKI